MVASASRLILSTSLRWSVNFSSWYSGFRLPLGRPVFFSSLCSQESCWVFLLLFSRVENIISHSSSRRVGGSQFRGCFRSPWRRHGSVETRGDGLDRSPQLSIGA